MVAMLPIAMALGLRLIHPGKTSLLQWIVFGSVGSIPLIAGIILSSSSEKILRTGLMDNRWPEEQVAQARAWLAQPRLRYWHVGVIMAWFSLLIVIITGPHIHFSGIFGFTYLMMIPGTSLARLKQLVALPSQPASQLWSHSKPLHSDHWGQQA